MAFDPFKGVTGGNTSAYPEVQRRMMLAQLLADQNASAPATNSLGVLSKTLGGALQGYLLGGAMDEAKTRDKAKLDTLSQALSAGQTGVKEYRNPDNPSQIMVPGQKPGMDAMVQVLMGNEDTAPTALNLQMQQLTKQADADAALALERGKYGLKKEFEPGIAAATEQAKTPALVDRARQTAEETLPIKKEIAAAGKPETTVKIDNKLGAGLADKASDIVAATQSGAVGAVETLDTTNRIRGAMKSANLGPGATFRQYVDQLAYGMGLGGQSNEERLAATREVMKGLAELSLSGRKALKGQGQVSDFEGKLLERAASGDIDSLTGPELSKLIDVTERIARKQYEAHQANLKRLQDNPNFRELAPFYEVPPLPQAPKPPAGGGGGAPASATRRWVVKDGQLVPE